MLLNGFPFEDFTSSWSYIFLCSFLSLFMQQRKKRTQKKKMQYLLSQEVIFLVSL